MPHDDVIDLRQFLDNFTEQVAGECQPVNHPRIDRVVVVLKDTGELSARDVQLVGQMAQQAAIRAGKVER